MFNKIKEEVKNYAERYNAIRQVFADSKRAASQDYIGSRYDSEFAKIKQDYDKAIQELQNSFIENINGVFEQFTASVKATVTDNLGMEVISELNLIKEMKLSEFEIKGYAEKYSCSPKALRILKGIAEQNEIPFIFTSHDDVLEMLSTLKNAVRKFMDEYQGDYKRFGFYNGDYECECMLAGDPIDLAEDKYNDFMNPFKGV